MTTVENNCFSSSARQFSEAVTYVSEETHPEKGTTCWHGAVLWVPLMVCHAASTIYTLAMLIVDLSLTVLVGVASLVACRKNEWLNKFLEICSASLLTDLETLSIGVVGTFAPPLSVEVHDQFKKVYIAPQP
jgi:hypothetical protein